MNVSTVVVRSRPGPGGSAVFRVSVTRASNEGAASVSVYSEQPEWCVKRSYEPVAVSNFTSDEFRLGRALTGDIEATVNFGAGAATLTFEIVDDLPDSADIGDTISTVVEVNNVPYTMSAEVADDPFDRRGRKPSINNRELIERLFGNADTDVLEQLADAVAQGQSIYDVIDSRV